MSSWGRMKPTRSYDHPQAHRLGYLLKGAQHALRIMMDDLLKPLGLTTPQYNVLSVIKSQPGISNAALAHSAFVTAQSMLGIVVNLERLGLIHREAHLTHGRIRVSELTAEGDRVLESAHALLSGVEKEMTSGFHDKEVESLESLLQRCTDNLRKVP